MIKQPLTVEHALLGFVRQQPMYGYEIHQRLLAAQELGLVWSLKQSLLYALLARLENEGYLNTTLAQQGSKPPRKMLALTPAGAEAFATWVSSPVEHGRDFRIEFLAKLYFARLEGTSAALALVQQQRSASAARLSELQAQATSLIDQQSFDWLVLKFRIGQLEAILQWLALCVEWVEAGMLYLPSLENRE
jgi:PadR family transcriptional regulator, regulatory protein AphA